MKNTKIKYKIFFLMMLLVISLNNVSAVTYENGTLEKFILGEDSVNLVTGLNVANFGDTTTELFDWDVGNLGQTGTPNIMKYTNVEVVYKELWEDTPLITGGTFLIGTNGINGTGAFYLYKKPTLGLVDVYFIFDENYNCNEVAIYDIKIYSSRLFEYFTGIKYSGGSAANYNAHRDIFGCVVTGSGYLLIGEKSGHSGEAIYTNYGTFINDYSIKMDYSYGEATITREIPEASLKSSSFIIKNATGVELFNSGYSSSNAVYNYVNESSRYYLKINANQVEYLILDNVYIPPTPPEDITPTLTTDKTNYNTSELLTISYTNIDEMDIQGVPTLFIVYPIIDDYHDYDAKFMQHLLSSKEDETFTINTSILQPQNEYYLVIADNTDWSRIESAYITSDVFYVYSDDEYLTTSCTQEGNCYTYNGGDISIYYNINNNSNIIIKDNNNNIIQTYYDIIGEGELNYYIPDDVNKLNSYPNWKFYLNNTEYETNYSTDVTIYWSLIATPEPTPIYTSLPIDENVSEMVDELKEESKPIFDLIYGLSELVVDNPDYDDDNIITENEMNNWFNSLIPIVIILLIFIVYTGLTKKR